MSSQKYFFPITDRTLADVTARSPKGYFNLADWRRVYDNAKYLRALLECLHDEELQFTEVAYPTITTFPTAASLNRILQNIIDLRENSNLPIMPDIHEIAADWAEGTGATSPDWEDANSWELLVEKVREYIANAADHRIQCGVGGCGQQRFFQHRFRTFAYAENKPSPRVCISSVCQCGASLVRGRKFRQYESISHPRAGLKTCGSSRTILNMRRY